MDTQEALIAQIQQAFADTTFPGRGNLINSYQSEESASIEDEFGDKTEWRTLELESYWSKRGA